MASNVPLALSCTSFEVALPEKINRRGLCRYLIEGQLYKKLCTSPNCDQVCIDHMTSLWLSAKGEAWDVFPCASSPSRFRAYAKNLANLVPLSEFRRVIQPWLVSTPLQKTVHSASPRSVKIITSLRQASNQRKTK